MNTDPVSLVIPGRDCARTIRQCLCAVAPLLDDDGARLSEIVFVDDGSTDETAAIVAEFPVTYVRGAGKGPGSARNIGWKAARCPLIWFLDADCVAEPDALDRLLPHLDDPDVGGVGGSYGNMRADSLLACLIHEEIVARHLAMSDRVNFLATFSVVYRREALTQVQGFDERFLKGQDAELAWRVLAAGYALAFEVRSRVKHFHPVAWRSYLRTQRQQGYWRVGLHLAHRGHAAGDSYSSLVDHVQPPLAMMALASMPLLGFSTVRWVPVAIVSVLTACQIPMTWRLVRRTKETRYLGFAVMSMIRSLWRGIGMTAGLLAMLQTRKTRKHR